MRVGAVGSKDKIVVVAHDAAAVCLLVERAQERRNTVSLRRNNDLRVVKRQIFVDPCGRNAHAERQPRIRRGLFERFGELLHAAGAQDDGRHADALQNADGRAHIRAVREVSLIVLERQLRDDRPAADVAERQHRCAQSRKGLRAAQIIKRSVLMQPAAESVLAQTDIVQRYRAFGVLILFVGYWRAVERNADRKRIERPLPFVAGGSVRGDRPGKPVRVFPP